MTRPRAEKAIELIQASGVLEILDERLPQGGRPRQLTPVALLVGMLSCFFNRVPPLLTEVTHIIGNLRHTQAEAVGLIDERGNRIEISYRQVRYLFKQILDLVDSTPNLLRKKGESDDDWLARIRAARPASDEAGKRDKLLDVIVNKLIEPSIPEEYRTHRYLAVDWTDVDSYAAGYKTPQADVSAWWGRRRSNNPGTKSELFFGYNETIYTMVRGEGEPVPNLTVAVTLDRPPKKRKDDTETDVDDRSATASLKLIPILQDRGINQAVIWGDSAYPHSKGWTEAIYALGWETVVDLHPNDMGAAGSHGPTTLIEGNLYCRDIPTSLYDIKKIVHLKDDDEIRLAKDRIKERERYRWKPKERPDAEGWYRLQHPATDNIDHDGRPQCCGQWTLRVPPDVPRKTRQKYVYQSSKWREMYNGRGRVEGSFSRIKDTSRESVDVRGRWRVMGRAGTQLMRALAWVSVNLRVMARFNKEHEEAPNRSEREHSRPRSRAGRRSVTLETMREKAGFESRAGPDVA